MALLPVSPNVSPRPECPDLQWARLHAEDITMTFKRYTVLFEDRRARPAEFEVLRETKREASRRR